MKSDLENYLRSAENDRQALNWMREYLQARVLLALQKAGAMIPLAFQGGTALRFLYQLPRFSEDLDFSLERQLESYTFKEYIDAVSSQLALEGYPVSIKNNDERVVNSAQINFPGLRYDLGLSPHQDQNFFIKLEVDTNPPDGATLATSLIRYRELFLNLQHHDKASLLAGKVHAVLQRPYLKGRDVYDLIWYLSDRTWPAPNFMMLNNALDQSGWDGGAISDVNWKSVLLDHLDEEKIIQAMKDVRPFLARPEDLALMTYENLRSLLA
jgi:hypothetical protein